MTTSLLADIGGTNARFALLSHGKLGPVHTMFVKEHDSTVAALRHYLAGHQADAPVDSAVIAAAGPVEDGRCDLVNAGWIIDSRELQSELAIREVRVVNDLEAVAWGLPHLASSELRAVGGGKALHRHPVALVAPGTGLGMAFRTADGTVVPSEGGHATLPAATDEQARVVEALRHRLGHVSCERVLSGPGLMNLYTVVAERNKAAPDLKTPADVTAAALEESCPHASEALDLFCGFLGGVAGNMALALKARGGVYVGGGIPPVIADRLVAGGFRTAFEEKGRFASYMADIPVHIILHDNPAFPGLVALAQAGQSRRSGG